MMLGHDVLHSLKAVSHGPSQMDAFARALPGIEAALRFIEIVGIPRLRPASWQGGTAAPSSQYLHHREYRGSPAREDTRRACPTRSVAFTLPTSQFLDRGSYEIRNVFWPTEFEKTVF